MRTATKLRFLGIAAALATAPALASGFPVPSFNDLPELYGPQAELRPEKGDRASAGTSRAVQQGGTRAPFVPYGPWITLPSSGS